MSKPRVVSFHYTLKDKAGKMIDSSDKQGPMVFMEGSGQIIPGLESELKKLSRGEKKNIFVKAQDAYGEYRKDMVVEVPRSQFPKGEKIQVGDRFQVSEDHEPSPVFMVVSITDQNVTLDGNHPLAGQDLSFDVEVTEIRDATQEEISHGHAHGPGGHHH
jgi:FKBP-type peptidyl-prolyl cis-trans isomerase SlyD